MDYVTISSYHRFYKISMAKLTTLTEVEFPVPFTCDGLADALKGSGRLFWIACLFNTNCKGLGITSAG